MAEQLEGGVELKLPRGPLELRLCEQTVCIRDTPCDGCTCAAFPSYPALVFDLRHQRNFWEWKHSLRLSELREFAQERADLLAWLEEVATGAEHVAEKLKREAEDFEDRAFYEDAERFTVQATAYRAVIQRLKEEGE